MSIVDYINAQAGTCAATLTASRQALAGVKPARFDRLILVGSGSSLNCLEIVLPRFAAALSVPVEAMNPAVLLPRLATQSGTPLVVVLSQSGTSTTSIEVARVAKARGWPVLAITAEAASPIGALSVQLVPLAIGAEPIGPKTKGFTASIMACLALLEALSGQPLPDFAADRFADLLAGARQAAQQLVAEAGVPNYVVVSGSGRFRGVALEASLKISEIAGLPAAAFEPEELLHGRLHGMSPASLGIMLVGDAEERTIALRTAEIMAERQVRIVLANMTSQPSKFDWGAIAGNQPAPFDAVAVSVPFQWLAVELALRQGMAPETMRYPGLSKALAIKTMVA